MTRRKIRSPTSNSPTRWVDQIGRFLDQAGVNSFGYSYVFNGTSGRLDQAFASASLSPKVMGALEWHINADEPSVLDYNLEFKQPACPSCEPDDYTPTPYRASDHDPVVVGLKMKKTVNGATAATRKSWRARAGRRRDHRRRRRGHADRQRRARRVRSGWLHLNMRDAGATITDFATPATTTSTCARC